MESLSVRKTKRNRSQKFQNLQWELLLVERARATKEMMTRIRTWGQADKAEPDKRGMVGLQFGAEVIRGNKFCPSIPFLRLTQWLMFWLKVHDNHSRYQGEDEDNLKHLENNANQDDGGGGVVETRTRKRGIKRGTGLWDQLDMDWIKSQIPFMHPKTKMHTFRLKHCLSHQKIKIWLVKVNVLPPAVPFIFQVLGGPCPCLLGWQKSFGKGLFVFLFVPVPR